MKITKYITVKRAVETLCNENCNWSPDYFTALLNRTPAEDVVPVIHAHWELEKDYKGEHHVCSHCHSGCPSIMTATSTVDNPYGDLLLQEEEEIDIEEIEYCPKCGAKMDEEEAEQ